MQYQIKSIDLFALLWSEKEGRKRQNWWKQRDSSRSTTTHQSKQGIGKVFSIVQMVGLNKQWNKIIEENKKLNAHA